MRTEISKLLSILLYYIFVHELEMFMKRISLLSTPYYLILSIIASKDHMYFLVSFAVYAYLSSDLSEVLWFLLALYWTQYRCIENINAYNRCVQFLFYFLRLPALKINKCCSYRQDFLKNMHVN